MNKKVKIMRNSEQRSKAFEIFPERNRQIYLDVMGYKDVTDTKPSVTPLSLREAGKKYGLSKDWIFRIKKRYRKRYDKSFKEQQNEK